MKRIIRERELAEVVALAEHVRSVVAIIEHSGGQFKSSSRDFTSYILLFVSLTVGCFIFLSPQLYRIKSPQLLRQFQELNQFKLSSETEAKLGSNSS